jgi:hypothetical protein
MRRDAGAKQAVQETAGKGPAGNYRVVLAREGRLKSSRGSKTTPARRRPGPSHLIVCLSVGYYSGHSNMANSPYGGTTCDQMVSSDLLAR